MICSENPSVSCIKTGCLTSRINIYLSQSFYANYLHSNNIVIVRTKNNVTGLNELFFSFICIDNIQHSFVKTKINQITFTVVTEFNSFCWSFLSCVLFFPCDMLLHVWSFILWLFASCCFAMSLILVSLSLSVSWLRSCMCHLLLSLFLLCG